MAKSVFGLDENIAAALSNATFGLFGAVALIKERENKFVRFHAMQAVITFLGLSIISWVFGITMGILGAIPLLGWLLYAPLSIVKFAIGLCGTVAWIYLSFSAYKGRIVKVPLVGDAVLAQLEK